MKFAYELKHISMMGASTTSDHFVHLHIRPIQKVNYYQQTNFYCTRIYSSIFISMDVVSAASDLRKLLVAHDNSHTQQSALDEYITSASQRRFQSSLEGNQSQTLHLALRLSVGEGMQSMYARYQDRKWQQIQEKARSITAALQAEEVEQTLQPPPGGSTRTDQAAGLWSSSFCEFYRDS